ncbi:MFS transporter [Candidatus Woesebacteria bacterium]|nr:MFS transporter [Candidatus Woesebacteria bacterium]
MQFTLKLKRNLKIFYFANFFAHLLFHISIWVAFQSRILTFTEMGLLYAARSAFIVLLEVPTGALADLIGRRTSLVIAWVVSSIGYFLLPFAQTKVVFAAFYIIPALGEALNSGSDTALLFDTLKELKQENHFSKLYARYGLFIRSALAIAAFFGGYLYTIYFGFPYFAVAVAHMVVGICYFFSVEPHIDSEKFSWSSYIIQTKQGLKELTKTPYIRTLSLYYLLVGGITWSCLTYFILPFLYDSGFGEVAAGHSMSIVYVCSAIILFIVTHYISLSRKQIYILLPVIMVIGLLPGLLSYGWFAPIMAVFTQVAGSGRFALLDGILNQYIQSKYRATAISTLNMMVSIVSIVLVSIGGKVQDTIGTKFIFTSLGLITLIIVFPIAFMLVKEQKE